MDSKTAELTRQDIVGSGERSVAFITGEKVDLRGVEREDLPKIARWLNDPDVTYYMIMAEKPVSEDVLVEQWEQEIRSAKDVSFAIVDRTDQNMIGWCGLYAIHWISRMAEFRVFVGQKDYWNKGVATEVARLLCQYGFEKLNLNKVYLGVNADSKGAVRAYEKAGFVKEGVLREEIYRNNQYYDAIRMSVLREEYERKTNL